MSIASSIVEQVGDCIGNSQIPGDASEKEKAEGQGKRHSLKTPVTQERGTIGPLSPPNRKRTPTMAKRSGQAGTVVRKGRKWHLRYLHDTPEGRIRKSVALGDVDEPTKTQAKRLGALWLHEQGINMPEHIH